MKFLKLSLCNNYLVNSLTAPIKHTYINFDLVCEIMAANYARLIGKMNSDSTVTYEKQIVPATLITFCSSTAEEQLSSYVYETVEEIMEMLK